MTLRPILAALVLASCGGGDGTGLDRDHLPGAAHGLVPGVATEAEVVAAFPSAPNPDRDETLGGSGKLRLDDQPAVLIDPPSAGEAWLVKVDGDLRLVRLQVPITDDCRAVVAGMGDRYKPETCRFTNRKPDPGEHRGCARTPGGKYQVSIDCYDRKQIVFWVHWIEATYRGVSMLRPVER